MNELTSLQNHLLIAMPSLDDGVFARSVTYLCEHNEDGAMGIILNQPSKMTFTELLHHATKSDIAAPDQSRTVLNGGPVAPDRGFVLHSAQEGWSSSLLLTESLMITTSKDILTAIDTDQGPKYSLVALGYAGWEAGQLEQEIRDNAWLCVEGDASFLFDTPLHLKWDKAIAKLGISPWQLGSEKGHA